MSRLSVAAVGLAVLETALLMLLGTPSNRALGPQVSAPEPLGVFHDLRWLLAYHPSWAAFAAELVGLVTFRTAIVAFMVREAWPDRATRPAWPVALRRAAVYVVTTLVLLAPWAGLLFGMAVVSLSWLFFAGVPGAFIVALLVHHGVSTGRWWRHRPTASTIAWVAGSLAVLSVAGLLIVELPPAAGLAVAGAAGAYNARAWRGVVGAMAGRPNRIALPARVGPVPFALAGLVGITLLGTALGVRLGEPGPPSVLATAGGGGEPVVVVKGFGSHWDGIDEPDLGAGVEASRFSYRGMEGGLALPYEAQDTFSGLDALVERLDEQVRASALRHGSSVTIVAESEGALVAKAYLLSHADAPVDALVMVSPLVRPGRVYYPPGGGDGWGAAAAAELGLLTRAIGGVTPIDLSADAALLRSIADDGARLRDLVTCPVEGVTEVVVLPLADAVASVGASLDGLASVTVPAFHGGLLDHGSVRQLVADVASGHPAAGSASWRFESRVVRGLSAAWQVPEVPVSLVPAWEGSAAAGCHSP